MLMAETWKKSNGNATRSVTTFEGAVVVNQRKGSIAWSQEYFFILIIQSNLNIYKPMIHSVSSMKSLWQVYKNTKIEKWAISS